MVFEWDFNRFSIFTPVHVVASLIGYLLVFKGRFVNKRLKTSIIWSFIEWILSFFDSFILVLVRISAGLARSWEWWINGSNIRCLAYL